MQEFVELGGFKAHDGFFLVDQFFLHHVDGHVEGGHAGAFADAALQHPELLVFDRELNVLHIMIVLLELLLDAVELFVNGRHGLLEGLHVLVLFVLGGLVQGVRGADARDHVFALGVDQPFTVELVFAGGGVAGESDAGGGSFAHVAEDHGLHVDGGAPVIGDAFDAAVSDGAFAVPGFEHGADAAPELSFRGVGELFAEDFFDLGFIFFAEVLQIFRSQIRVALVAFLGFQGVHDALELAADAFAVGGFDAFGLLHDDVGVHGDQAAVSVINETLVGLGDEARDRLGAKTDVQNGLHHAGHGLAGAGTAGNEKRILLVAELLAHDFLHLGDGVFDLAGQAGGVFALVFKISGAAFSRDSETAGDGQADGAHFSQVRAFAAEEVLHVFVTFRLAGAESIDVLRGFLGGSSFFGGSHNFPL